MVKMHSKTIAVLIDIHNAQDFENPMTRRELTRIIENTQRNIKKQFQTNILLISSVSGLNKETMKTDTRIITFKFLQMVMRYGTGIESSVKFPDRCNGVPAESDSCISARATARQAS